ncbi:SFT2 [Ecytonucleospora hepatopenaei]|uniref:Protein transport protein SFT2 n=1 Tax=Ecytonucleospora hepatopenaei TaxID=646526 RepID=A0A1W0E8J5_9MICR|nr:SFT2 [Ecytonucleospora hepatopenaei]
MAGKEADPLFMELNQYRSKGGFFKGNNTFFESKFDFEYFGLSYSQRFLAFVICFVCAIVTFFYALMNTFYIPLKPYKFAVPYAFSNLFFFIMIGFLKGFKSYFRGLNAPHKRLYTYTFLISTFMTIYFAAKSYYIVSMFLMILQIASFGCFAISFIPGGAGGLSSMLKMMFKGWR